MRYLTNIFILLAIVLGSTYNCSAQYDSIYFDTQYRTYQLHLPLGYNDNESYPLVIALHGGFGAGPQLENQSQLSAKADAEGFIVVYPEGVQNILNIRTWNGGSCCGYAVNNNIDDVGFISNLIDSLQTDYSVNQSRVYATGMSNGAFLAYKLACELSDKIAAIAPVAGSMNVEVCNPSRPVPVIQIQSKLDDNIPYLGGNGNGVSNHYNPPLDSVLNVWATTANCTNANDTTYIGNDFTSVIWSDCDCHYQINYYLSEDGGHSWAGGNATGIGDPVSNYISANDLMWDFFEQHSLDCQTTEVKTLTTPSINYTVSQNILTINDITSHPIVSIFNLTGKLVYKSSGPTHNIAFLDNGLYLLHVLDHNINTTDKILITN